MKIQAAIEEKKQRQQGEQNGNRYNDTREVWNGEKRSDAELEAARRCFDSVLEEAAPF